MRTILYARVSTSEQTAAHQLTQATAAGFAIDEVVADEGVSGVATRLQERPQGRRLYDMLRGGDVLVVRWVDRLGRNYSDVVETIQAFMRRGVVIKTVINSMVFDGATSDPMQKAVRDALIGFMAATAQAQAEATKAAQRAGIDHRKLADAAAYRGRALSYTREQFEAVISAQALGTPVAQIARDVGLTRPTVHRIVHGPDKAEEMLTKWGR